MYFDQIFLEQHLWSMFTRIYNSMAESTDFFQTVKLESVFNKSLDQVFTNNEIEAFLNVRTISNQIKL